MSLPRRAFLRMGSGALISAIGSSVAIPALAQVAAPALMGLKSTECRTLALQSLHTGEKLKVDYWVEGNYLPDALASIDHVLRDHRTGDVHRMEPKLLDLLNALHGRLETNSGFQVISGYRSPKTNAMLHEKSSGVASKSLHMLGQAIDIRVPGCALDHLHQAALGMKAGGVGYYPKSDFVHVDVGRVRHWA
jgi:uncharacterized protein YcbK (DUF882 family)